MRKFLFLVVCLSLTTIGVFSSNPYSLDIINLFSTPESLRPISKSQSLKLEEEDSADSLAYGVRIAMREACSLPKIASNVDLQIECQSNISTNRPITRFLEQHEITFTKTNTSLSILRHREDLPYTMIAFSELFPDVSIEFGSNVEGELSYELDVESYPEYGIGTENWSKDILSSFKLSQDQVAVRELFHYGNNKLESLLGGFVQSSTALFESQVVRMISEQLAAKVAQQRSLSLDPSVDQYHLVKFSMPSRLRLAPPSVKATVALNLAEEQKFFGNFDLASEHIPDTRVGSTYWSQDILGSFIEARGRSKIQEIIQGDSPLEEICDLLNLTIESGIAHEYHKCLDNEISALALQPIDHLDYSGMGEKKLMVRPSHQKEGRFRMSQGISEELSSIRLKLIRYAPSVSLRPHELSKVENRKLDHAISSKYHIDHMTLTLAASVQKLPFMPFGNAFFSVRETSSSNTKTIFPCQMSPNIEGEVCKSSTEYFIIHLKSNEMTSPHGGPIIQSNSWATAGFNYWQSLTPQNVTSTNAFNKYSIDSVDVDLVAEHESPTFYVSIDSEPSRVLLQVGNQSVAIANIQTPLTRTTHSSELKSEQVEKPSSLSIADFNYSDSYVFSSSNLPFETENFTNNTLLEGKDFGKAESSKIDELSSGSIANSLYDLPMRLVVLAQSKSTRVAEAVIYPAESQSSVAAIEEIDFSQSNIALSAPIHEQESVLLYGTMGAEELYRSILHSPETRDVHMIDRTNLEMQFTQGFKGYTNLEVPTVYLQPMSDFYGVMDCAWEDTSFASNSDASLQETVILDDVGLPNYSYDGNLQLSCPNYKMNLVEATPYHISYGFSQTANTANRSNRVTHLQLAQMPTLEVLDTDSIGDEFSADVKVVRQMAGEGFIFSVRLKPNDTEFILPEEQTVYYLIDQGASVENHRFDIFKEGVAQSLKYLHPKANFNIVFFGQNIDMLNFDNDLCPTKSSISYAQNYLKKKSQQRSSSVNTLVEALELIKGKAHKNGQLCSCVLLTDGKFLKNIRLDRAALGDILSSNSDTFALYTSTISDNNNAPMLELLAKLSRGEFLHAKTHASFPRKLSQLVKKISRPLAHGVYVTQAEQNTSISLAHENTLSQQLFADRSFNVYGTASDLDHVDLFIQGERCGRYVNIRKKIPLQKHQKGRSGVEKEYYSRLALGDIVEFILSNNQTHLIRAQSILSPFENSIASK